MTRIEKFIILTRNTIYSSIVGEKIQIAVAYYMEVAEWISRKESIG
jgi:hypothetical protein